MKALLLAAGFGTRLRPLTDHTPKCLVPIRNKPLLQYWFDMLFPAGVEAALVNTHYLPDAVRAFVADSPWRDRVTLVHEKELLQTGGTVLANRDFFGAEPFIVAHADNLTRFDVQAFTARHKARPPATVMTMMTFETDAPQSCGIVVENEQGLVTAFHEKVPNPPGNHANAAVYIFEPEVVDYIASLNKPIVDLSTEVIPHFIGRICTFHNDDYHRDIGTLASLQAAERDFAAVA